MKLAAARKTPDPEPENKIPKPQSQYAVYIFHEPGKHKGEAQNWEMKHSTTNLRAALTRARALHNTRRYMRVEVKGKYFDIRTDRKIDFTLKTFEDRSIPWEAIGQVLAILALGAMAAFCGYALISNFGV